MGSSRIGVRTCSPQLSPWPATWRLPGGSASSSSPPGQDDGSQGQLYSGYSRTRCTAPASWTRSCLTLRLGREMASARLVLPYASTGYMPVSVGRPQSVFGDPIRHRRFMAPKPLPDRLHRPRARNPSSAARSRPRDNDTNMSSYLCLVCQFCDFSGRRSPATPQPISPSPPSSPAPARRRGRTPV
jgi:hypothetical protein